LAHFLKNFFEVAVKSKGVKVGGIIGTSGGLVALVFGLHSNVSSEIQKVEVRANLYTDLKLETVDAKLKHLKEGQIEIKTLIKANKTN